MQNLELHMCHINYEDNVKNVLLYLKDHLDQKEFQTLFDHAKFHQQAFFQDREGNHYIIDYRNGEYFIIKK